MAVDCRSSVLAPVELVPAEVESPGDEESSAAGPWPGRPRTKKGSVVRCSVKIHVPQIKWVENHGRSMVCTLEQTTLLTYEYMIGPKMPPALFGAA